MLDAHDKLVVALDVPDIKQAWNLVDTLGDLVNFYKIGNELIYQNGLELAQTLKKEGKKIFIDAQLSGVARTVLASAKNIERLGADIVTLHGNHSCLEGLTAYRKERGFGNMKLCFITVLTSEDETDLRAMNQISENITLPEYVQMIAEKVKSYGGDGVIASAHETAKIRQTLGKDFLIITPGIRPESDENTADDQKRVATPAHAISAGADYLVVGRPITQAGNPKLMAQTIINQIEEGMNNQKPLSLKSPIQISGETEGEVDLAIPHEIFDKASQALQQNKIMREDEFDTGRFIQRNEAESRPFLENTEPPQPPIQNLQSIPKQNIPEKKDKDVPQWEIVAPKPKPPIQGENKKGSKWVHNPYK